MTCVAFEAWDGVKRHAEAVKQGEEKKRRL